MAAEWEGDLKRDGGPDDEDEGCEAEMMALVVIDEFPTEASHQRKLLFKSTPD